MAKQELQTTAYPIVKKGDIQKFPDVNLVMENIIWQQNLVPSDKEAPGGSPYPIAAGLSHLTVGKHVNYILMLSVGQEWLAMKPFLNSAQVNAVEQAVDHFINALDIQFVKITGKGVGVRQFIHIPKLMEAILVTPGVDLPLPAANVPEGPVPRPAPAREQQAQRTSQKAPAAPPKPAAPAPVVPAPNTAPRVTVKWIRTCENRLVNLDTGATIYIAQDLCIYFNHPQTEQVHLVATARNQTEAEGIMEDIKCAIVTSGLDFLYPDD